MTHGERDIRARGTDMRQKLGPIGEDSLLVYECIQGCGQVDIDL